MLVASLPTASCVRHFFHYLLIDEDTAVYFTSGVFQQGSVGADADCKDKNVKVYFHTALHDGSSAFETNGAVREQETHSVVFQVLLHHGGAFVVENTRKDPVRQVADGHALNSFEQSFRTFEPDQSRADDEDTRALVKLFLKGRSPGA